MDMNAQKLIDAVMELVKKGNVSHIVVNRQGKEILNFPVTVGAVGAIAGLAYAKWLLLAGVLAAVGYGCTVKVVNKDGSVVKVLDEEGNQKVRNYACYALQKLQEALPISISVDIKREEDDADAEVREAEDKAE
jgi:hypothetical protein